MHSLIVRYHNVLRSAAGLAEERVALSEDTSLYALLQILATAHGSPLHELLLEADGSMASHLVVFHNRQLASGEARTLVLKDGDEVMLFPAVSGG